MQVSVRAHTSSETANSSLNQLWFTRERVVLGPHKPACPVGDVPGFASTGPVRDRESAAHSGDGGETHWIDLSVVLSKAHGSCVLVGLGGLNSGCDENRGSEDAEMMQVQPLLLYI